MSKFCINFVGDSLSFTSFSHTYQSVNKAAATVYGEGRKLKSPLLLFPSSPLLSAAMAGTARYIAWKRALS